MLPPALEGFDFPIKEKEQDLILKRKHKELAHRLIRKAHIENAFIIAPLILAPYPLYVSVGEYTLGIAAIVVVYLLSLVVFISQIKENNELRRAAQQVVDRYNQEYPSDEPADITHSR